jgi:hypothetical protein
MLFARREGLPICTQRNQAEYRIGRTIIRVGQRKAHTRRCELRQFFDLPADTLVANLTQLGVTSC